MGDAGVDICLAPMQAGKAERAAKLDIYGMFSDDYRALDRFATGIAELGGS
jgi:hypothetical protein